MNKHSMVLMSRSEPDDQNGSVQTPGRLRETEGPQAMLGRTQASGCLILACLLSSLVPCLYAGCSGRAGEPE